MTASPMTFDFDLLIKLYEGVGCAAEDAITCVTQGEGGFQEQMLYQAPTEGWYTIVVDGPGGGDAGPYTMIIELACDQDDCGCR